MINTEPCWGDTGGVSLSYLPSPTLQYGEGEYIHRCYRQQSSSGGSTPEIIITTPDGYFHQSIHPLSCRIPQANACIQNHNWNQEEVTCDSEDNRSSSGDTNDNLFNDIDNFIHENNGLESEKIMTQNQIDLDCDEVFKQLILT